MAGLENVTLVALAGKQYRMILQDSPWPYVVPMKGLGIGKQLGWLTGRLRDHHTGRVPGVVMTGPVVGLPQ